MTCFTCTSELEIHEGMYFCPYCTTQLLCKKCNKPLLKGAIGCGFCGTSISSNQSQQNKLNEIEFEQKGDSKKFKATFTDTVGHDLVATFGGLVGISPQKKRQFTFGQPKPNINLPISNGGDDIEDVEELAEDDIADALRTVFKADGDNLILQTTTFKAKTEIDKAIRVSLLTLLAYKTLHNTEDLKRSKLTEVLVRSKLNSGNFRRWISKSEEIATKSNGYIFLTTNGIVKAIDVLKEVLDPNVVDGKISFNKSKSKKKKSSGEEGDEVKRASGKSPKEFVLKLLTEDFFKSKRSPADILQHLKDHHATNFNNGQISTVLSRLIGSKTLKREKGETGVYVYFV